MLRKKYFYHKIIFSIYSILILGSCNKDTPSDVMTIGDKSKMKIEKPELTLSAMNGENSSFFIDIDKDDIDDFEIIHGPTSTPNYPNVLHRWIQIRCLNETSFVGIKENSDTMYLYNTYTYHDGPPMVEEYQLTHHVCDNPFPTSATVYIKDEINYCSTGDIITLDDNWSSTDMYVYQQSYETDNGGMSKTDTLVHFSNVYEFNCINISNDIATYIPIKKIVGSEEKLGWILVTKRSEYDITINQFAIQK